MIDELNAALLALPHLGDWVFGGFMLVILLVLFAPTTDRK